MKKKKKPKIRVSTILILIIFFVGLSVLLYPTISYWYNSRMQSKAIDEYNKSVVSLSEFDYSSYLQDAEEYNEAVARVGSASALTNPQQFSGYEDVLDVTGSGMIGYVTISKINLKVPIYHGTETSVLSAGAGHLEGSSLPIGGESTHSVIAAHRGLPSALLFTDLDQMQEGDIFTITVLNETLIYEVDQISIVLPEEIEDLYIVEGEDYCTLMTCTPYGINTHRLLVRGKRTDISSLGIQAEAYKVNTVKVAGLVAIPILLVILIWVLVVRRQRNSSKGNVF